MSTLPAFPPFWVTASAPASPLKQDIEGAVDLSSFENIITEANSKLLISNEATLQSLVKAKDWLKKSKQDTHEVLIKQAKGVLENNPFASLGLDLIDMEQKEYFNYLIMHPVMGGVDELRAEVLRVLNKTEMNVLDKTPILLTGAVIFGTASSNANDFVQTITNYINMITTFFGNNPAAAAALITSINTPSMSGLVVTPDDEEVLTPYNKDLVVEILHGVEDTANNLDTMMEPKGFMGQFLQKSNNNKDQILEDMAKFKVDKFIDLSAEPKTPTIFKSEATFSEDSVSIKTSRKAPLNRWIRVDKINHIISAVNEQMEKLKAMMDFASGASDAVTGVVELALNGAIAGAKKVELTIPPILTEVKDLANDIAGIGADMSFSSLIIPPHETRKPDLEGLMQKWISKEYAPEIPLNSNIFGAVIVCYAENEIVLNIAHQAIKLFLGGTPTNAT